MKKVLLVATVGSFVPQFEINNVKILREYGHEVHYASNFNMILGQDKTHLLRENDVRLHQIDFSRSPYSLQNLKAFQQLKNLMSDLNFSLVHCHTPVGSVLARLIAAKTKTGPVIYTTHGFQFHKKGHFLDKLLFYPVERVLSSKADVIITINQEDYECATAFKKAKVERIPGVGIDVDKILNQPYDRNGKRDEIAVPSNAFLAVSVGELSRRKNHIVLVKALSKLQGHNLHLVICGEGDESEALLKTAESEGISGQIHLLGYRKDVVEILKASDLFLFPSKVEGLGLAGLEAMACGLPIVTSDIHGINDYSEHGVTGFKCSPDDVDAFAEYMEYFMRFPEEGRKMGQYNQTVVHKFDKSQTDKKMREIYKSII